MAGLTIRHKTTAGKIGHAQWCEDHEIIGEIVGTPGPQGPKGDPGDTGPQGPAGIDGAQGPQGATGPAGADGPQGPAGNDGAQGPQGIQGLTGPQGPKGDTGDPGPQGIQGIAGPQGIQGPAGNDGLQGPAGNDGATGPQGPQGPAGADGAQGPQGIQGIQGPEGPQGSDGWTWSKLGADIANSTVTLATSGLSFTAAANTTYLVKVVGAFQSAATTTGMAMALDIPSGSVIGLGIHPTSATALIGFEQVADNAITGPTTAVRAANTNVPVVAEFIVAVGASGGSVTLMFRSEIAASAVTLKGNLFALGRRVI